MDVIGIVFIGMVVFGAYFAPYLVAVKKSHKDKTAIGALNFFLGWTLLGWIVSLVWALKKS